MTDYNRPSDLPAWAESGDKTQPSNAEIQTGWTNTGIPPSRQRFNWILNWVANAARYFMQLGIPEYSSTEAYRAGSRVQYSGATYKALATVTGVTPGTDATKWEKWGFLDSELQPRVDKVLTKSVAGSADVTLTAAEADNGIIILTGILTGNINVIFPNVGRRWTIYNGTTGSFTVGAKTTAGSAVTVKQGDSNNVYCDGSNAMRLSGSGNNTAITSTDFTATAGQTVFSVSYTPGNVLVFRNGTKVPFTGTNGTSITLATGASAGDIVTVVAFSSFSVANALPLSGGTVSGNLNVTGVFSGGGTTTNNNAAAGQIGEHISALVVQGSAIPLTTSVGANVTSISLTAGDWDVSGYITFLPTASTSFTALVGGASQTSGVLNDSSFLHRCAATVIGSAVGVGYGIPVQRFSLAAPTTIYLVAAATFTASTMAAYGGINARRIR